MSDRGTFRHTNKMSRVLLKVISVSKRKMELQLLSALQLNQSDDSNGANQLNHHIQLCGKRTMPGSLC
jgi:hypothetical protein